jgi:hypothetical protein
VPSRPSLTSHCKVSRAAYEHLVYRLVTLLRGILVTAIYDKTLHLSHTELKSSAAVTLMSTDINGVATVLIMFHDLSGRLSELVVGIYILYRVMGPASFLILVPFASTLWPDTAFLKPRRSDSLTR